MNNKNRFSALVFGLLHTTMLLSKNETAFEKMTNPEYIRRIVELNLVSREQQLKKIFKLAAHKQLDLDTIELYKAVAYRFPTCETVLADNQPCAPYCTPDSCSFCPTDKTTDTLTCIQKLRLQANLDALNHLESWNLDKVEVIKHDLKASLELKPENQSDIFDTIRDIAQKNCNSAHAKEAQCIGLIELLEFVGRLQIEPVDVEKKI